MVELAGTAPASAGLSWLNLSYRYSLFGLSRRPEKNKQITDLPQFQVLMYGRNSPTQASRRYRMSFSYLASRETLLPKLDS